MSKLVFCIRRHGARITQRLWSSDIVDIYLIKRIFPNAVQVNYIPRLVSAVRISKANATINLLLYVAFYYIFLLFNSGVDLTASHDICLLIVHLQTYFRSLNFSRPSLHVTLKSYPLFIICCG